MNVNKIAKSSILSNRYLLKGLEKVSEHATTIGAGTSFLASVVVRPLVIMATPDVEKENKQYSAANSICSGLIKFGLLASISLPVENAVKLIDKNPEKFLSKNAVEAFKDGAKPLIESRKYNFATQLLKLGTGFVTAVPKSVLTIALIPVVMDKMFDLKSDTSQESNVAFKGRYTEKTASWIGKLLNKESFQKFVNKHQFKDKDIAKHLTAGTDILLTGAFVHQTAKSKKIKENRKKALIYNNIISTVITLLGGYAVDNFVKTNTDKFVKKFAEINKNDSKLHKYIEGLNIIRPIAIFAGIYYGILPMFSTYFAEKIDKFVNSKADSQ